VPAPATGWQWTADGRVFFGFNYLRRKFTDFSAWESQNWVMATGQRQVRRGALRLASMFSFEPFTLHDIGSPQVFQTGEMFRHSPIIDYQHPHDLVMGLGAEYRRPVGRVTLVVGADVVGAPTLGPPVRPSAAETPHAPLSHHHLDSSHITPVVLRGGVDTGSWRIEGSWFHGRGPDSNRTDLDLGALDSAAKDILDVGFHPGAFHRHRQSQVGAITAGYVRDWWRGRGGALGSGADVTGHLVPANLEESYGSPLSVHAFVRCRLPAKAGSHAAHTH
jgi:hypothetical protein